ncbi:MULTISPECIES: hypothetical protein [Streptomyces]|uniref:Uncharacterized protein n=1 Tax=Streptomyces ramulosus TaxID=47762 RepID=A0ABW1FSY6_9ACTN
MTPEFCYVLAPSREALEDQLRTSRPELAPLAAAVLRRAFCILVADHEESSECAHALCLTELSDGYALWVRWTDHEDGRWRRCWFEVRRNCPDAAPDGEPCVLYLDHAGLHSWTATRSEAQ